MEFHVGVLLLIITTSCSGVSEATDYLEQQPKWLKPCNTNSEDLILCATTDLQAIFRQIVKGLPGFTAFESVDPYYLGKVELEQSANQPVSLKFTCEDCKVFGFKNVIVTESKVAPKDHLKWLIKVFMPKMRLSGTYNIDGRILTVPLKGKGNLNMEFQDMNLDLVVKVKVYKRNNLKFYNVTDIDCDYKINGLKVRLDNLFNGNKDLGEATNAVINENWREMEKVLRPVALSTVKTLLLDVVRSIFNFIPAEYFIANLPEPNM